MIAANIVSFLLAHKRQSGVGWTPLLGIGTAVPISPSSLPQPDVYVQEGALPDGHITDDALVIFEILSRSNPKADQEWRRKVYASVPNCQHYVTVSLARAEVTSFDRATGWKRRTAVGVDETLDLPALGLSLPLADVYRYTALERTA